MTLVSPINSGTTSIRRNRIQKGKDYGELPNSGVPVLHLGQTESKSSLDLLDTSTTFFFLPPCQVYKDGQF